MQDSGANTLGVVVGGSSIELRKLCATEVSKRNVSGYFHLPLNTINFQ
jgi:queuine tRNA-ribosyltransferase subunit QTRTD1